MSSNTYFHILLFSIMIDFTILCLSIWNKSLRSEKKKKKKFRILISGKTVNSDLYIIFQVNI